MDTLHPRLNSYLLFFCIFALLLTSCSTATTPGPSNVSATPSPETLADEWNTLEQRPVRIPTPTKGNPCPLSKEVLPYSGFAPGKAPISIRGTNDLFDTGDPTPGDIMQKEGWKVQKEVWFIHPPYQGPILVRGHQLYGPHILLFNGGYAQTGDLMTAPTFPELLLLGNTQYDYPPNGWGSYSYARVPGCYVYQLDGLDFSGYFIFQVAFASN